MKDYLIRKNLFIFKEYPQNLTIQDSYILIYKKEDLTKININDIQNVFTIFYLPVWIVSMLKNQNTNIIYLNELGKVNKIHLYKNPDYPHNPDYSLGIDILTRKAFMIENLFDLSEATSLLNYSISKNQTLKEINKNLNFLLKSVFLEELSNYHVQLSTANKIIELFFNLTENIVAFSFYEKLLEKNINPSNGILNSGKVSLIKDLTEISRLKFLKKLHYLLKSKFFDKSDFLPHNLLLTVVKFIKLLSTYFFYGNRFKRLKEMSYILQLYKRGKLDEIPDYLWHYRQQKKKQTF